MFLLLIISIATQILCTVEYNHEITICQEKLHKVLTFITTRYFEFNFDGLFGVVLAQAQLLKIHNGNASNFGRLFDDNFYMKCQEIKNKIIPLLPQHPPYMITFAEKLLNAGAWNTILRSKVEMNKIKHLPHYENWTVNTILNNKAAVYKGINSDVCLQEILSFSKPSHLCHISPTCHEMMLDKFRVDTGYLLTHRLLYILITDLQQCVLPDVFWTKTDYVKHFCSYIYRESKTSEYLGYPYHDVFLEQVLLCGMEGVEEFLSPNWFYKIIEWQTSNGCYRSIGNVKSKKTSNVIDFGCSDHSTGLGAATLALYLRYFMERVQEV